MRLPAGQVTIVIFEAIRAFRSAGPMAGGPLDRLFTAGMAGGLATGTRGCAFTTGRKVALTITLKVNEAVFDEKNDRYLIMSVGWEGKIRRIHGCLAHLDIINGKIWIQRDGTEDGIAYDLEAAGIPKSDIVPAFHSESVRPHTGYAVA